MSEPRTEAGTASWPTPNDVAVMLNALLAFRAALKEAQS